jgi:hypothetical protein
MSSLKDVLRDQITPYHGGTLAHGVTPPMGPLLDYLAEQHPSYRGTLSHEEVYDIFGVERGDALALARRLLRDRWPGITVVDKNQEPQRQKRPTVAEQVLLAEINGIKERSKAQVQRLRTQGLTVDQIQANTGISRKQIKAFFNGQEMTDEAAADIHLCDSGRARPGHNKEILMKTRQALKTRISRARKAIKSLAQLSTVT